MSAINRVHLLLIDPQNDFCDPKGSLFVTGSPNDSRRSADLIKRLMNRLDDIHVTLDSHRNFDIAHPLYWKNSAGKNPTPFTLISVKDVENGVWTPTITSLFKRSLDYVKALEKNGKYVLCIWPPHCLIGSWGHNIQNEIFDAITEWEKTNIAMMNVVTKGSNPYTEHYSAIKAEVPDPQDHSTQINKEFIKNLEDNCDTLVIGGQAASHCVKATVEDIVNNFSDRAYAQKIVLLTDAMSPVPGFEKNQQDFFDYARNAGIKFSTTADFLK
jgi:nicotinamidase-related amidase